MPTIKPLKWSAERPADHGVRYSHVIAETPFGRFLIDWKAWKSHPSYDVSESPISNCLWAGFSSLDDAKKYCETAWGLAMAECHQPSDQEKFDENVAVLP
jgi:hypothetical protein